MVTADAGQGDGSQGSTDEGGWLTGLQPKLMREMSQLREQLCGIITIYFPQLAIALGSTPARSGTKAPNLARPPTPAQVYLTPPSSLVMFSTIALPSALPSLCLPSALAVLCPACVCPVLCPACVHFDIALPVPSSSRPVLHYPCPATRAQLRYSCPTLPVPTST